MVYTILIFQRPKWLLSGSLEHETSMDIERIVVGERICSNMIATATRLLLESKFRLLVQQFCHILIFLVAMYLNIISLKSV